MHSLHNTLLAMTVDDQFEVRIEALKKNDCLQVFQKIYNCASFPSFRIQFPYWRFDGSPKLKSISNVILTNLFWTTTIIWTCFYLILGTHKQSRNSWNLSSIHKNLFAAMQWNTRHYFPFLQCNHATPLIE